MTVHELMLNFVFHKTVPKLKEVQEGVDKAEEALEEDLMVILSVMEPKVVPKILLLFSFLFSYSFSFFPQTSKKIVFCYQNCSDILCKKIVLVIEKNSITRTIYSSSKRSEKFLNLFLEVSQIKLEKKY